MYAIGFSAYDLMRQLPSSHRHDIMSDGNGVFWASDMDWDSFLRDDTGYGMYYTKKTTILLSNHSLILF